MEGFWKLPGGFLEGSWRVPGEFMEGSWRVHGGFMRQMFFFLRITDELARVQTASQREEEQIEHENGHAVKEAEINSYDSKTYCRYSAGTLPVLCHYPAKLPAPLVMFKKQYRLPSEMQNNCADQDLIRTCIENVICKMHYF